MPSARPPAPVEVTRGPRGLADPRSLHVATLLLEEGLTILASSDATAVRCPVYGEPADRVNDRYVRTLAHLPWVVRVIVWRSSSI